MPGSLLSIAYPDAAQWRALLDTFDPKAIAHKLLLAHVPFVFRDEPLTGTTASCRTTHPPGTPTERRQRHSRSSPGGRVCSA
jgi:hypothetical protein